MFYKIKGGHSFRDADGSVKTGGQFIELDDDTAETHDDKLDGEGVESLPVEESAPSGDPE